jgi:aryl carrier-like protein
MPSITAGEPPTIDVLRAAVAEVLNMAPDAIPDDTNLVRLGLDSLGMLRLANLIRRAGFRVPFKDMVAIEPTLLAWERQLNRLRRPAGAAE